MTVADLDLEVEEEAPSKGIDPPAYWPSRDGSVVVENLTCHYAPQVSTFMYKLASLTSVLSLTLSSAEFPSLSRQGRKSVSAGGLGVARAVRYILL